MKKKEFELIARVLKYADQEGWTDHIELIAHELADEIEANYRVFDRDRFLKACGVKL